MTEGFHVHAVAGSFDQAFTAAKKFYESVPDGVIVLGPHCRAGSQKYLLEQIQKSNPVVDGKRVRAWSLFLEDLARTEYLHQGGPFQLFTETQQREYLRGVLTSLAEHGLIKSIENHWQQEKLFQAIVQFVNEVRLAGLSNSAAVEQALDIFARHADESGEKFAFDELFTIVLAYEKGFGGRIDHARVLEICAQAESAEARPVFLLGFSRFVSLEIDFLQQYARRTSVQVALNISRDELRQATSVAAAERNERLAAIARLLGTSEYTVEAAEDDDRQSGAVAGARPILVGHTPAELARGVAWLAKNQNRQVNIVAADSFCQDPLQFSGFSRVFGIDTRTDNIEQLHLQERLLAVLHLKAKNYPLFACLDLLDLLDDPYVARQATRAGVSEGLAKWQEFAEKQKSAGWFYKKLQFLDEHTPEHGSALQFQTAFRAILRNLNLPKRMFAFQDNSLQKVFHEAVNALLQACETVSSESTLELTLEQWLTSVRACLQGTQFTATGWQNIRFYRLQDLIPANNTAAPDNSVPDEAPLTILYGFDSGCDARQSASFFMHDRARLLLSDFGLKTSFEEEEHLSTWLDSVLRQGETWFAYARHGSDGKEQARSWLLDMFADAEYDLPPTDFLLPGEANASASATAMPVQNANVSSYSATLLESYAKCPFRTLIDRVWKLEEGVREPELDVSPLGEGSLWHDVLETYFKKFHGRHLTDPDKRRECFETAWNENMRVFDFYASDRMLAEINLERMKRHLWEFLLAEHEYYDQFPHLLEPICEENFEGELQDQDGSVYPYRGRFDRIDHDQTHFTVIDYKRSTTPASKEVFAYENLQPYYYIRAGKRLTGKSPVGAYYVSLRSHKRNQGILIDEFSSKNKAECNKFYSADRRSAAVIPADKFHDLLAGFESHAVSLARAIRQRKFPVTPKKESECNMCAIRPGCRIRERMLDDRRSYHQQSFQAFLEQMQALQSATENETGGKALTFSAEQQAILDAWGSLIFVEAAAGSGKSTILVEKYFLSLYRLIDGGGLKAADAVEKILVLSFTEKSVRDLRARISRRLQQEYGSDVAARALHSINTIHGFSARLVRDHAAGLRYSPMVEVLSESRANELKQQAVQEFFLQPDEACIDDLREALEIYSRKDIEDVLLALTTKRSIYTELFTAKPDDETDSNATRFLRLWRLYLERYDRIKADEIAVDFNDIETGALQAVRDPLIQTALRSSHAYIFVDEFQDTNAIQNEVVSAIAAPEWSNVFVVGDGKQSIYRFRAADVSVFQQRKAGAREQGCLYELSTNYRSQAAIVAFFNRLFAHVMPARAEEAYEAEFQHTGDFHPAGKKPVLIGFDQLKTVDEKRQAEADFMAKLVKKLLAQGRDYSDIAILMKKVSGNQVYMDALEQAGIPYVLGSSSGFFRHQFVLDVISAMRLLVDADNKIARLAFLRSPFCHLDDQLRERLILTDKFWPMVEGEAAVQLGFLMRWRDHLAAASPSEFVTNIALDHPQLGLGDNRHLAEKLISIVRELEPMGWQSLVKRITAHAGWSCEDAAFKESAIAQQSELGAVQIMTVHAAKGLEFPVVILADLDGGAKTDSSILLVNSEAQMAAKVRNLNAGFDKTKPYEAIQNEEKQREIAESKRLFYVAITRAESELYMLLGDREKPPKEETAWADWLRSAELGDTCERMRATDFAFDEEADGADTKGRGDIAAPTPVTALPTVRSVDCQPLARETFSVTELAAYYFCPEFHRFKFVLKCDDSLLTVNDKSGERRVQNVHRGIAIHRVFELIGFSELKSDWESWLRDTYESLGFRDDRYLREVIDRDISAVDSFYQSELGQQLFRNTLAAHPEHEIVWRLNDFTLRGSIDRLVQTADEKWLVVDYKLRDGNLSRYRFQVASYMRAVAETGISAKNISGLLIDIQTNKATEVAMSEADALESVLAGVQKAHITIDEPGSPSKRGVREKPECGHCPYAPRCAVVTAQ